MKDFLKARTTQFAAYATIYIAVVVGQWLSCSAAMVFFGKCSPWLRSVPGCLGRLEGDLRVGLVLV